MLQLKVKCPSWVHGPYNVVDRRTTFTHDRDRLTRGTVNAGTRRALQCAVSVGPIALYY